MSRQKYPRLKKSPSTGGNNWYPRSLKPQCWSAAATCRSPIAPWVMMILCCCTRQKIEYCKRKHCPIRRSHENNRILIFNLSNFHGRRKPSRGRPDSHRAAAIEGPGLLLRPVGRAGGHGKHRSHPPLSNPQRAAGGWDTQPGNIEFPEGDRAQCRGRASRRQSSSTTATGSTGPTAASTPCEPERHPKRPRISEQTKWHPGASSTAGRAIG